MSRPVALIDLTSDDDVDDKVPAVKAPISAQIDLGDDSDDSLFESIDADLNSNLVIVTKPAPPIPARPTAPALGVPPPVISQGLPVEPRSDYGKDGAAPIVSMALDEPTLAVEPARPIVVDTALSGFVSDRSSALNEFYSVRRTSAHCARWAQAFEGRLATAPTEVTLVRPPEPIANRVRAGDGDIGVESYLALEYVSPLVNDAQREYVQGDKFGFSDTVSFATGRAVDDPNPDDAVAPKRLTAVDTNDSDERVVSAANYQHAFLLDAGRHDVTLPVSQMSDAATPPDDARAAVETVRKLAEEMSSDLARDTAADLERIGTGVASLFAALTPSINPGAKAYDALKAAAQTKTVAEQVSMSLERARDVSTTGIQLAGLSESSKPTRDDALTLDETLSALKDALAETAVDSQPNIVRARAAGSPGGVFSIPDGVLEYDVLKPAAGLADDADVSRAWIKVDELLLARERFGADVKKRQQETNATEPDSQQAEPSLPRRRLIKRARRNEDGTIASEAKPGKRKQDEALDDEELAAQGEQEAVDFIAVLDREEAEPREGEELQEGFDPEDVDALETAFRQENYEEGGIRSTRNTDVSAPGFLSTEFYRQPVLAVPIGWSAAYELKQLCDEMLTETANRAEVWRTDTAWRRIVELALYAKLVPRLDDDAVFPEIARRMLVATIELVAKRVSNEVVFQKESSEAFAKQTKIRKLRLQQRIDVLVDQLGEAAAARAEYVEQNGVPPEEDALAGLDNIAIDEVGDENEGDLAVLTEAQRADLVSELDDAARQLRDETQGTTRPAGVVPAVFVLRVLNARASAYVAELDGEMPSVLFSESQRRAVAIVYAASSRRPVDARNILEVEPLFARNDIDALAARSLAYPQDTGYLSNRGDGVASTLEAVFASVDTSPLVVQFAKNTNLVDQLSQFDFGAPNAPSPGRALTTLYEMAKSKPTGEELARRELALTVYPALEQAKRANSVKEIGILSPLVVSVEQAEEALNFIEYLYTDFGAFSLKRLNEKNDAERDNLAKRAQQALEMRGSERLLASAAQRDANEFFSQVTHRLDETRVVPVDFDLTSGPRPVGLFPVAGNKVAVAREQTIDLLRSDQLLGGGRILSASVAVEPPVDTRDADKLRARLADAEAAINDANSRLATARARENARKNSDGDEELGFDEIDKDEAAAALLVAEEAARDLRAKLASITAPREKESGGIAFPWFLAPATLFRVCERVPSSSACAEFVAWYRQMPDAAALRSVRATYRNFNAYHSAVESLAAKLPGDWKLVDANIGLDAMIETIVNELTRPEGPRTVALREETTRPDTVVTQPFSDLSALERASTDERKKMRDDLLSAWYRLGEMFRWARLGYMQLPFNTSHTIDLPLAATEPGLFDTHQTVHLALRAALRRAKNYTLGDGVDEGDSDSDDDNEDGAIRLADETDEERRSGVLQLQTLLNALENETARVQSAQVLWIDVVEIGGAADQFARSTRDALIELYTAINSGRGVVGASLLSSKNARHYTTKETPLPLDPRATTLVAKYWTDYGGARVVELRNTLLDNAFSDQYGSESALDEKLPSSVADAAFYSALTSAGKKLTGGDTRASASAARVTALANLRVEQQAARDKAVAEHTANKRLAPSLGSITGTVDELVRLTEAQAAALSALEKALSNADDEKAKLAGTVPNEVQLAKIDDQVKVARKAADDATALVVASERKLRAHYGSNTTKREERVDTLLDEMRRLRVGKRLGLLGRFEVDVDNKIARGTIELRGTLYADERNTSRATLTAAIEEKTKLLRKNAAERALRPIREQLRLAAAAAFKAGQIEKAQRSEALDAAITAFASNVATSELPIGDDFAELRKQFETNVATNQPRALPAEQKRDNALRDEILILRIISRDLDPLNDTWRQKQINQESRLEKEEREAVVDEQERAKEASRAAIDAELNKLQSGALAESDLRHDVPETRSIEAAFVEGGYYDAPLANHKEVTTSGLWLANEIVSRAKIPADIVATLQTLVPQDDDSRDKYVEDALKVIESFTEDTTAAEGPIRLVAPANEVETRRRLRDHIDQVVQTAVRERLQQRFAATRSVAPNLIADVNADAFVTKAIDIAQGKFDTSLTGKRLAERPLRQVDAAALRVVQSQYETYRAARAAQRLLLSLGERTLVQAVGPLQIPVVLPRLIALLLAPAAIERAKLKLQQQLETRAVRNWAVANRQDAPQAWRIAEIVARYMRDGSAPLTPPEGAAAVSPYDQYMAVRKANAEVAPIASALRTQRNLLAKLRREKASVEEIASVESEIAQFKERLAMPLSATDSISALGRIRFFDDRAKALRSLRVAPQRVSFGSGLHSTQPCSVDIAAAALCIQLMRIGHSVQPIGASFVSFWPETQLDPAAIAATQLVAALPSARTRLWCHLAMLFGTRGAPTDALFPYGVKTLSFPVWQYMRPIDIRLLILATLGFDYAVRAGGDDGEANVKPRDTYTRGHAAKYTLARAYYNAFVDRQFLEPFVGATSAGNPRCAIVQTPTGEYEIKRTWLPRGVAPAATLNDGRTILVQCDPSQMTAAVAKNVVDKWKTSSQLVFPGANKSIGAFIADLTPKGGLRDVVKKSVIRATLETASVAAFGDDVAWLHVPRAAIVGSLVQLSLSGASASVGPEYVSTRDATRRHLLEALEKIFVLDDSAHLLRDDAPPTGRDLMQLDQTPIATDAVEIAPAPAQAALNVVAPVVPRTDVFVWRKDVENGIASLLGSAGGQLKGVDRAAPWALSDWPFAPIPSTLARLDYVQIVLAQNDATAAQWAEIRRTIDAAQTFTNLIPDSDLTAVSAENLVQAFRAQSAGLSEQQLELASMLARAEITRRVYWNDGDATQQGRDLASTPDNVASKARPASLFEAQAEAGVFQNWHVLLLRELAQESTPKEALIAFAERNRASAESNARLRLKVEFASAVANTPRRATASHVEQVVPIGETIIYYFETTLRNAPALYRTSQRQGLWSLLTAPLLKRAVVTIATTETRSKIGIDSCAIDLPTIGKTRTAFRAFAPASYGGYTRDAARLIAGAIDIADQSAVLILHEHQFASSDEKTTKKRATYAPSTIVVLSRYTLPPGAPPQTVAAALDNAAARTTGVQLLGKNMPFAPSE